tara:strand:+ start:300 stop:497 length:198 start_codon:yes stop_codon:yes gene_type:complete
MNDFEVAELHEQVQKLEAQVQYLIEAMLGEEYCDDCCCNTKEEAPVKEEAPAEEAEDESAADEEE